MADHTGVWASPAYRILRPSARTLLAFVTDEIGRQGGGACTIHNDQFAAVGSRRVYLPGLIELHELGLVEVKRLQKRHLVALSVRWRTIRSVTEAQAISAAAREMGKLTVEPEPPPKPQRPAVVAVAPRP